MRIFYAAGPGDVAGTYAQWRMGFDDPKEVSVTYSSQFFDVCKELGARARVFAWHPRPARIEDDMFTIEHGTIPLQNASGALYHAGQIASAAALLKKVHDFRADIAIFSGGAPWFALRPLGLTHTRVIAALHCVLWPQSGSRTVAQRAISRLDAPFFRRTAWATLSASDDITRQVTGLAGGSPRPIFEFLPTYRREVFDSIGAPNVRRVPFRVLYAGRIEVNKGVFDLATIARRFADQGRADVEFDVCGKGSMLEELRARTTGLGSRFRVHGHCDRNMMRQMFEAAHVVIAPTTTSFIEGFNQVVAEGILAGRPVVTSSVCPALEYVRDGVVEVPPDDVEAYGDAILRLCDDADLYTRRRAGCLAAQAQFYDPNRSFAAALRRAIQGGGGATPAD